MNSKVLCVDDDANVLKAFRRNLRGRFDLETCSGGEEALALIGRQGPYAVVVADMRMPGMDGVQLLTRLRQEAPDTVRIMLTGNADQQTAVDAVNQGHVFRFLTKPCPPEELALALTAALREYRLTRAERELLEHTLSGSVKVLGDILALQDPTTFGQCQIVRERLRKFLRSFVAGPAWPLEIAVMLYRIGLITIPPAVLHKARNGETLSGPEQDLMDEVPELGARLLQNIPRLESVAEIVRYQCKHFDGTGHPRDQVAGEEIPLGARVLKVLADWVELESRSLPRALAVEELRIRAGWYDPRVREAALAAFDVPAFGPDLAQRPGRMIKASELQLGQMLLANVETLDGMMIIAAGNVIYDTVLQKIRNFATLSGLKEPIRIAE